MLTEARMLGYKPIVTPMDPNSKLLLSNSLVNVFMRRYSRFNWG